MNRNGRACVAVVIVTCLVGLSVGEGRAQAYPTKWWTDLMGATALSTQLGFMRMVPEVDVTPDLPRIACPTLVVTTTGSGLGSVAEVEGWQKLIPGSELLVLPGDSYHVAGSDPDTCAPAVLRFVDRHRSHA